MKYLLTIFFIIINLNSYAIDSSSKPIQSSYFKLGTAISLKHWKTTPTGQRTADLEPSVINFGIKTKAPSILPGAHYSLIDYQANVLDSNSIFNNFTYATHNDFSVFQLQVGLNFDFNFFKENSTYKKTQYDYSSYGLYLKALFKRSRYNLYFSLQFKKTSDGTISNFENIKTHIAHDADYTFKVGANVTLFTYTLISAISAIRIGETSILSNEFYYKINSDTVFLLSTGVSKTFKRLTIVLKYNLITNFKDEVSLYYQAPHFGRDYMLSSQSAFLEFRWRI